MGKQSGKMKLGKQSGNEACGTNNHAMKPGGNTLATKTDKQASREIKQKESWYQNQWGKYWGMKQDEK